MSRRNLILILLAGFVLALGAAGAAQRDADRTAATSAPPTAQQSAPGGTEANVVEGDLPADRIVRAKVGDDIEVRIASSTPDVARLIDLGLHAAVGPGLRGAMRFRALSPGRFPVTLEVAGTSPGAIVVQDADQDAGAAP